MIVGGGPAGIGTAVALQDFGIGNYLVLERACVGASFLLWNKDTRLLTPSFQSTQFGLLDLNAIAINTSPAYSSGKEHLNGEEYAMYLLRIANAFKLNIREKTEVNDVQKVNNNFIIETHDTTYHSKYLVWAAGEFQFPDRKPFPGAEHCLLLSDLSSYTDLEDDEYFIIGGYESGVDASIYLSQQGKKVNLIEQRTLLAPDSQDPSVALSFYTRQRLDELPAEHDHIRLFDKHHVTSVCLDEGLYKISTDRGCFISESIPLLATGFKGGEYQIEDLFDFMDSRAILNQWDESIKTAGLFLAGPHVKHDKTIFCFIYKFRQRFGVIAGRMAEGLNIDTQKAIAHYRNNAMYLDDLSCCNQECTC